MFDVVVIGAGIVGSLIARKLSGYQLSIAVIEKEPDVGNVTTMANSAIVHSGYDPKPGTLKAKLKVLSSMKMGIHSLKCKISKLVLQLQVQQLLLNKYLEPKFSSIEKETPELSFNNNPKIQESLSKSKTKTKTKTFYRCFCCDCCHSFPSYCSHISSYSSITRISD